MKAAKVFAVIFGILGILLMLGTAGLCFASLDAPVRAEIPAEAADCAEVFCETVSSGDLTLAAEMIYGKPDLGTGGALTEEAAAVWEIYRSGISCQLVSDVYVSGSGFAVDAVITVPEIASITDSVAAHGRVLLDGKVAAAEKMAELYDESGEFRQDLIDEIMDQAVALAFAEEPQTQSRETTFGLVYAGKQWYVVPDAAFLQALQGGL